MQRFVVLILLLVLVQLGCNTLTLKPGDFAWPIESVLKINDRGMIQDQRHCFTLNVKELFFVELQDSVNIKSTLRVIRSSTGYYFITAPKFRNVYVFEGTEGGLKSTKTILIKQQGLESPAFNQRSPFIQLINENDPPVLLTNDGIQEGGKK